MSVSANLTRLIEAAAPYWAGEAEVVRTYKEFLGFGAPGDLGPFRGPLEELRQVFGKIDVEVDRHEVQFTEGGYCTLFTEGMRLGEHPTPGHEETDRLIAEACARVYDAQFGHPVGEARVKELLDGRADPIAFDYARASL